MMLGQGGLAMIRHFVSLLLAAGLIVTAGGGLQSPARAQASASAQEIAKGDKALARKQYAAALDHYDTGCDAGNGEGCFDAGRMYELGQGVKPSASMAARYYESSCYNEYADGCARAGLLFNGRDGVAQDYDKAFKLLRFGCDFGSVESCSNLGFMYDLGRGVAQDRAKAREYYLDACNRGYAQGCTNQGLMLAEGEGGPVDAVQGRAFLKRGCDGGDKGGCAQLAKFDAGRVRPAGEVEADYRMGLDSFNRKLYPQAYGLLRPFADEGREEAEYAVGFMLAYGQGTQRNYLEAAQFLARAAERGDTAAQDTLVNIAPKVMEARFIEHIDRYGPSTTSLSDFFYDVNVYCIYGGPNCSAWRARYYKLQRENNMRAEAANMARIWNNYGQGKSSEQFWSEARARSECLRRVTQSIEAQNRGRQQWRYVNDCK